MNAKSVIMSLSIVALFIMTSCATVDTARHKYTMKGQILESTSEGVYICIGSADGAAIGQEYKVFKFVKMPPSPKSTQPNFKKEETGMVKITEIVDEHYAIAKIIAGEAKENYIVELHR